MGMPRDNVKGYVEADATQRARYIPSHSLYLLHGLADVTAPFLHGVTLARALTQEGVVFRYQVRHHRHTAGIPLCEQMCWR